MQRLILSRSFLLARRVSLRPVNFPQCKCSHIRRYFSILALFLGRQLSLTTNLDRRVRRTKRTDSEKAEQEPEPEDHLEAFEKYRKVQQEKKKIRSKEEKAKANVLKEENAKKERALNMAVNILLGIILLIGLDSLYRYIDLTSQMRMQEGTEQLELTVVYDEFRLRKHGPNPNGSILHTLPCPWRGRRHGYPIRRNGAKRNRRQPPKWPKVLDERQLQ